MFCKICNKPTPPQFDLCFEHRQAIKQKIKKLLESNCIHMLQDGAGAYCSLMPMSNNIDYPHKFYRTECFGRYTNCKDKSLYQERSKK